MRISDWSSDVCSSDLQFDEIAWGRIKINLIRENWSDLIRLAGSIKLGHLKAAGVMRMLQVKDRPTTLAKALSELGRSEEHTSELQSLMRISYAVFCLKKKTHTRTNKEHNI